MGRGTCSLAGRGSEGGGEWAGGARLVLVLRTLDVAKNSHVLGVGLLVPACVLDVPLLGLLVWVADATPVLVVLRDLPRDTIICSSKGCSGWAGAAGMMGAKHLTSRLATQQRAREQDAQHLK